MRSKFKNYINSEYSFDKKTLLAIFSLIIVFSGIFGFFYEYVFYFFNSGMKQFYWRGGNFLPWINIYATGALFIYFFTYKHRKNPLKVFSIGLLLCGLLEYFSGLILYTYFDGIRWWNYNIEILNFGNIGGFICLRSVLFFGLSGLFLIYLIVPLCFHFAKTINKKLFLIISFTLCFIFLSDEIYNLLISKIFELPNAYEVYKSLGIHYISLK